MLNGFHALGGLYFERTMNGSVAIKIENDARSGGVSRAYVVSAEAWASIVAAMSLRGENGATYQDALAYHTKPED